MALAKVSQMSFKMPGRGRVNLGVYKGTLNGYLNGTGFAINAATFGLTTLLFVAVEWIDAEGDVIADWDPSTGYLKAYTTAGVELANDALDSISANIFYVGF
jgi:hypothetical protein